MRHFVGESWASNATFGKKLTGKNDKTSWGVVRNAPTLRSILNRCLLLDSRISITKKKCPQFLLIFNDAKLGTLQVRVNFRTPDQNQMKGAIMDRSSASHLTIFRRVRNDKSRCASGGKTDRAVVFDATVLVPFFGLPLEKAARELHVCTTALKR
jgi:hypothetical protein